MAAVPARSPDRAGFSCCRTGRDNGRQEIERTLARKNRARQSAAFGRRRRRAGDGGCRTEGHCGSQEHGASSWLEGSQGSRGDKDSIRSTGCRKKEAQEDVFQIARAFELSFHHCIGLQVCWRRLQSRHRASGAVRQARRHQTRPKFRIVPRAIQQAREWRSCKPLARGEIEYGAIQLTATGLNREFPRLGCRERTLRLQLRLRLASTYAGGSHAPD
jgi:hypothetical protein